jgi:phage terminase large subunit GpA-like protein
LLSGSPEGIIEMTDRQNDTPALAVLCPHCDGWQALSVKREGMEKENAKLMKRACALGLNIQHGTVSQLREIPECECRGKK